jgi:hypothetical protein
MLKHKTTNAIVRSKSANFDPSTGIWYLAAGKELADPNREYEFIQDPPTVSAIQYKMLFTSAERIAAKASTDPVIVDLQELLNDPRTDSVDLALQSISDALDYMTYIGLIMVGRKAEILTGEVK